MRFIFCHKRITNIAVTKTQETYFIFHQELHWHELGRYCLGFLAAHVEKISKLSI